MYIPKSNHNINIGILSEPSSQELDSVPVERRLGFYFNWLARILDADINFQYMCQLVDEGANVTTDYGIALNIHTVLHLYLYVSCLV